MEDDHCFVELFKLRKMFENSFNIRGEAEKSSIHNVYNNETVAVNILLRPTDPDFDASVLSTPEGIEISLKLHRVSGHKHSDSLVESSRPKIQDLVENRDHSPAINLENEDNIESFYSVNAPDDIEVNDPALPDLFKKSIQKVLYEYITKNRSGRRYVIYESLKFLDKNLARIYNISNSVSSQQAGAQRSQESDAISEPSGDTRQQQIGESQENPWTLEEQKCLEDGLVRAKALSDPREKWLFISKLVKTRTPEECRRRFIRCREVLVKKNKPAEPPEPEEPSYSVDRTYPLAFTRLDMIKLSLGKIGSFSMEILCTRCAHKFEVTMIDLGERTVVHSKRCEKCNLPIRCEFTPSLFFPAQLVLGRLSLLNADFIDFNYGEFKLTCEECETQSRIRDVKIGDKKSLNCRGCFAKFMFAFDGVQFGDHGEALREAIVKKVIRHEPKKPPQVKGIKAGTPLPDNGTCKHYKKSFRWFRFPCCGRLFPCDVCHDDVCDHKCGFANVIVCGFCSTQQPSSNKVCKSCNKGCAASAGSHWEVSRTHSRNLGREGLQRRNQTQQEGFEEI